MIKLRFGVAIACLLTAGDCLVGQAADTARRAHGATVTGIVYDSIGRSTLGGAVVELAAIAPTVTTLAGRTTADGGGRYTFTNVPPGRYAVGFLHPMLDSLGIESPLRPVKVTGDGTIRADVAIPGAARLRRAVCELAPGDDSSGVVLGFLRDARALTPVVDAPVTAQWLELVLGARGFERRVPRLTTYSRDNGWFAICGVPSLATIAVTAAHGTDSTASIDVELPATGFLRRDLYIGPSRRSLADSSTQRADSLAAVALPPLVGDGILKGVVIASAGGKPVSGAHVNLEDGPRTDANERGEWTIADAPLGTRMLVVRAVGYYPDRRVVNVVDGAPLVRVSLPTLKAVLDTVRVTATRLFDRDRNGFQARRRTGLGRYLGPQEIERLHPIQTSDVFRTVLGLHVVRDANGFDSRILMRGVLGPGSCEPAIYIDGMSMRQFTLSDIDAWVQPADVAGIEVYTVASAPPQYQTLNGCGSILIWTK